MSKSRRFTLPVFIRGTGKYRLVRRKRGEPTGPFSSVNSHIWASYSTVNSYFENFFELSPDDRWPFSP